MKDQEFGFLVTEVLINLIGLLSFWGVTILMIVWCIDMDTLTSTSLTNPSKGNEKTYIYDVDFYETMTITEKETL